MHYQENAHDFSTAKPEDISKFEVGARLRFVGCSDSIEPRFQAGDIVRTAPRNGCGMGIDAIRETDGVIDMVWPWEVELAT